MSDITLIMLCAGRSTRFSMSVKKQWLRVGHTPLWNFVTQKFNTMGNFSNTIVVGAEDELPFMQAYGDYTFAAGGESRQESLQNALQYVETPYVLVSDIARACVNSELLERIVTHKGEYDVIVPYLNVSDTVVYGDETINRDDVKRLQTPQLSRTAVLKDALQKSTQEFTDESSAIYAAGGSRFFVPGDEDAHKITLSSDLNKLRCLLPPSADTLSGNGFDVHAFEDGTVMWLGGVKIDAVFGFKAHSDGDVAIHALIDALLGAAGMGDIGMLFPDNDPKFKGIDSKELLTTVVQKLYNFGFVIINVDITIAAQTPKLASFKMQMRTVLAEILKIERSRVNIKATTTEKLGFIGRAEGVGVLANANLQYYNWKI